VTGADAILTLERAGVGFRLAPDGRLLAHLPARLPDGADALLDVVRQDRDDAVQLVRLRSRPCLGCGADAGTAVLCPACHDARRERLKLVPFDPERRKRAVWRAYSSTCSTCGACWWRFNGRGDAWCVPCWRETRRNFATSPQAARPDSAPTVAIPPAARPGGAA
jgi:hypothetical protein